MRSASIEDPLERLTVGRPSSDNELTVFAPAFEIQFGDVLGGNVQMMRCIAVALAHHLGFIRRECGRGPESNERCDRCSCT
jgi:hypothetical protein